MNRHYKRVVVNTLQHMDDVTELHTCHLRNFINQGHPNNFSNKRWGEKKKHHKGIYKK